MKLLDDWQCDALQDEYVGLEVVHLLEHSGWKASRPRSFAGNTAWGVAWSHSRQKALTSWQHSYAPGWQPPEPVHDAEWALKEIIGRDLGFSIGQVWKRGASYKAVDLPTRVTIKAMIAAVEAWIDKYATPEPTAVEILNRIIGMRNPDEGGVWIDEHTVAQARAVIEREKGLEKGLEKWVQATEDRRRQRLGAENGK